ncbi:MAG: DUF2125 domain-containing protein [Paracoccaceae bacterium]
MRRFAPLAAALALPLAQPALADLTPDDAWAIWTAQATALGLSLDATETHEGAALQIGKITLSGQLPDEAGSFYLSFTGPRFEPAANGAVSVLMAETVHWDFGGALKGEGSLNGSVTQRCDGALATMTGTPQATVTEQTIDKCTFTLTSVSLNGEALDLPSSAVRIVLNQGLNRVETALDDTHLRLKKNSQLASYDLSYHLELPDKGKTGVFEGGGSASDVDQSSELTLPKDGIDPLGLHDQLRAGLSVVVRVTSGAGSSFQRVTQDGTVIQDQTSNQGASDFYLTLDSTGFSEGGTMGAFSTRMTGPELPFPVALSAEGFDVLLKVPLLMGEGQDANFRIALRQLTLGDDLWALFDPAGKLPRDPMSVAFDLGAKVSILYDFLDIRALMAGAKPPEMPVMVKTARLGDLRIAGAGAELTGQGDVTLDYTDMETFDGLPAPEGQAAVTITGAQGLLDKLVELGLLPEEQAMGTRMMLAMFTKPSGDDSVTSEVEIRKTGEVTVNGQRVK